MSRLGDLVAIPSISTDPRHRPEVDRAAVLTGETMRWAGLQNVRELRTEGSNPIVYGDWLGAPGKPTVILYSHYDVQPVTDESEWRSKPWSLTRRDGRLFGRGAVDDKGAVVIAAGVVAAYLSTLGRLPINVKMVVEGEEEVGSRNLLGFFRDNRSLLGSDAIIACDTATLDTGSPNLTCSLRGSIEIAVEVRGAAHPIHSGAAGVFPDAALALDIILARLYGAHGRLPIPDFYGSVRPLTWDERNRIQSLEVPVELWRCHFGLPPSVRLAAGGDAHPYVQMWREPAIAIVAQESCSIPDRSGQLLPRAAAVLNCRTVPDQSPDEVVEQMRAFLSSDPPWGVEVTIERIEGAADWWIADLTTPVIKVALDALRSGFDAEPVVIGNGGSIGFIRPLSDLLGNVPVLLFGIADPICNAHGPDESLHEPSLYNLLRTLIYLFDAFAQDEGALSCRKSRPDTSPDGP